MRSEKKTMYIVMTVIVFAWGLEYVFAKQALASVAPITLVFLKYLIGATCILFFRLKQERRPFLPKRGDLLLYVFCALFGEIGYFVCEYSAMDYLPVSLITIVLSFVPVVSLLLERILYQRKITGSMMIGVLVCTLGVGLVIGADFRDLLSGRLLGYLLAFGAVLCWNLYNFLTASLTERYSAVTLTFNQQVCSILIIFPYAVRHWPPPETFQFESGAMWGILYLGVVGGAISFLVQVKALHIIGVTPASIFSNFIPVTSTLFGWVFLGEMIAPIQMFGGAVILASACIVIREKERTQGS